jgi:low temperature requirement protein LtrA
MIVPLNEIEWWHWIEEEKFTLQEDERQQVPMMIVMMMMALTLLTHAAPIIVELEKIYRHYLVPTKIVKQKR